MSLRLVVSNDRAFKFARPGIPFNRNGEAIEWAPTTPRGFKAQERNTFEEYQLAFALWHARRTECSRIAAIEAHDAWAVTIGGLPIQNPQTWGFN